MCRRREGSRPIRTALLLGGLLGAALPSFSQPRFEVTGRAEVVDDRLLVTLEMSNVGSEPASDVEITAELAEQRLTSTLPGPIEPG